MSLWLLTVALNEERDVVAARQRARQIAELLGFDVQDRTRIATAVSEIARNAFRYAGTGRVEFALEGARAPQRLVIHVVDCGPGIADVERILDGRYESATGMGLGIVGSKRLMDHLELRSRPGEGTEVILAKTLPAHAPFVSCQRVAEISALLAERTPASALQELEQQNRELVRALNELRERQDDLSRLNRELEDTNRGVVALYAELEERADHLRRSDEMKTRFLSNMSHELRTPLNSIRALSRLLLDRIDGPLTEEQAQQVELIRAATEDLSALVDDLLDIAKIAAGKTEVRPTRFDIAQLFGMLRGMLRPLLHSDNVTLHFAEVPALPPLYADEAKVSQILRNLISNALKFTERGEVRVWAETADDACSMHICVADTGIGIAPQDQEFIFEEFAQIAGPLQARHKGTGLGLPLSRRLAKLLGGTLSVESTPGVGSKFCLTLPLTYVPSAGEAAPSASVPRLDPGKLRVLVVHRDPDVLRDYELMLEGSAFQLQPARSIRQARELIAAGAGRPAAVLLDVERSGDSGWAWLGELKSDARTKLLPIIVTAPAADAARAYVLGADVCLAKPLSQVALLAQLDALSPIRVLVIDDDPTVRYTVRRFLGPHVAVLEAEDGVNGLRAAARLRPILILLDLQLPDMSGAEVLQQLKTSPTTRDIPVVIVTSLELDDEAASAFGREGAAILPKSSMSGEALGRLLREAHAANGMVEA